MPAGSVTVLGVTCHRINFQIAQGDKGGPIVLRRLVLAITLSSALVLGGASAAFADSTGNTGQPNQSCQAQPSTPGKAATAPGSAVNTNGVAGSARPVPGQLGAGPGDVDRRARRPRDQAGSSAARGSPAPGRIRRP